MNVPLPEISVQRSVYFLEGVFGGSVDGDVELCARFHLLHLVRELSVGHQERGDPPLVQDLDESGIRKTRLG